MHTRLVRWTGLALLAFVVGSVPAAAQSRRPFNALFGGLDGNPASRQTLDLTASAYGTYDDKLSVNDPAYDPRYNIGGVTGGFDVTLAYARRGRRIVWDLNGGTGMRRDALVDSFRNTRVDVSTGLTMTTSRRDTLSLRQTASYSPYYLFQNEAGVGIPFEDVPLTSADFAVVQENTYGTSSEVTWARTLSEQSALTMVYTFRYWKLPADTAEVDFDALSLQDHRAGILYARPLTRNLSLRLGYNYGYIGNQVNQGQDPLQVHEIDSGVEYSKPLPLSRRTTLSLSASPAIFIRADTFQAEGPDAALDTPNSLYVRVHGSVGLTHYIGRTWTASASARRGAQYIRGLGEPYLSDEFTVAAGGLVLPRVEFGLSASYSTGTIGFGSGTDSYDTMSGTARLGFGLTRFLAAYAQYVYYNYQFGDGVVLLPGIAQDTDRRGVRVGLTSSVPLLR